LGRGRVIDSKTCGVTGPRRKVSLSKGVLCQEKKTRGHLTGSVGIGPEVGGRVKEIQSNKQKLEGVK